MYPPLFCCTDAVFSSKELNPILPSVSSFNVTPSLPCHFISPESILLCRLLTCFQTQIPIFYFGIHLLPSKHSSFTCLLSSPHSTHFTSIMKMPTFVDLDLQHHSPLMVLSYRVQQPKPSTALRVTAIIPLSSCESSAIVFLSRPTVSLPT